VTEHIRLLIADDHPVVRAGLRDMLSTQPDFEVIGEATTGAEAVKLTDRLHPHVVLMDLRMPEMDGVTATTEIKAKHPSTYMLILTNQDGDAEILSAIEAGATGYLLKDSPPNELFRAIRAAAQGKPLLAPDVLARLLERMKRPTGEPLGGLQGQVHALDAPGPSVDESDSPKQEPNQPIGTVTFLFSDIEDSTSVWERHPVQMQAALARYKGILSSNIKDNGGYIFKTVGEAYCVAFTAARQALAATLAIQRALFAEEWGESIKMRVRMALHTGVTEERNGDYLGPSVDFVAALLSAARGGQILLSAATYELMRDNLEPGAKLNELGEHSLQGLRDAERIYQLVAPSLPSDFPPLKTFNTGSNERYSLTKLIGSGGVAEVYLAHDKELDRDVAFKVLRKQYADDEQLVERFEREAKNVALLSHQNIVAVYDRGKTKDGAYYIVMAYVPGGNLKERILREGSLSPPVATAIALQIAQALRVAHEHGMVHRDIKPQNILLTESNEVKVTDFGIARAVSAATVTQEGAILGSAHYLSPEQALGHPVSPQSDLYSLGIVLYEMLTGELPHDAETPVGIVMKHVSGQLRPPREVNPEVPSEIDAVTVRLLARASKERYPDADELIADLKRVQRGELPAFVAARQEAAANPTAGPAPPSVDTSSGGRPQAQEHEPATPPASPATEYSGGSNSVDWRRRVLPRAAGILSWVLVIVLAAVAILVVVEIILVAVNIFSS
jgi:serine/threonine protein kinase/DNA-binding NarL/FixJ family response regulator/class 3 adenylate cyclase